MCGAGGCRCADCGGGKFFVGNRQTGLSARVVGEWLHFLVVQPWPRGWEHHPQYRWAIDSNNRSRPFDASHMSFCFQQQGSSTAAGGENDGQAEGGGGAKGASGLRAEGVGEEEEEAEGGDDEGAWEARSGNEMTRRWLQGFHAEDILRDKSLLRQQLEVRRHWLARVDRCCCYCACCCCCCCFHGLRCRCCCGCDVLCC